jgi:hypothetical protein
MPEPAIVSMTRHPDGFHVIDEFGDEVVTPYGPSGTFAVSNDWQGGTTEIRWFMGDDSANNRSSVRVELWAHTSGFTTHGDGTFRMRIGDDATVAHPVSIGGSWVEIAERSKYVSHNSDGSMSVSLGVASGEVIGTSFNSVSGVQTKSGTNYNRLPSAPSTPTDSENTASGMKFSWNAPSNVGGGILEYQLQYSTSSSFSGATTTSSGTARTKTLTGLAGGTKYYARVRARTSDGWGSYSGTGDGITVPVAPSNLVLTSPTTTGMTASWDRSPSGPEVSSYEVQWDDSSSFLSPVSYTTTEKTKALTGMIPGTTHYVRVRATNGEGTGAWSLTASQTTLPAVPPGLVVAATPSGTGATLTFSPPGGVTGVDKYDWERRDTGTSTVVTGSEADTVESVTGLTPGKSYDWRASAWIDTYESPQTAWITLVQPKPNVSAGDYFDGNTPDSLPDSDYSWDGTANNSTSKVSGLTVAGWSATFNNTCAGTIQQVTDFGISGAYVARVQVNADATAAGGFTAGIVSTAPAEVGSGGLYVGSIHVLVSKKQRLQAYMRWYDAGGAEILPMTVGEAVVVNTGSWVRLAVTGTAPTGAVGATVRVTDVAGTDWSAWQGGDAMRLDAAMITLAEEFPYFDGSTLDTDQYVYEWEGTPHASASTRNPIGTVEEVVVLTGLPDSRALVDPDCATIPKPPRPPSIPSDCIENIKTWRRYYVSIPAINISDWLSVMLTLEIHTGAKAARQVRIRVYPNPFNLFPNQISTTEWCAEQIVSYLPPKTVLTLDGVTMRAWAEVNQGAAQSADHLLYGTGGKPPTWPILSCGISYLVSLEVPSETPAGNISTTAFLTTRT